MRIVNHVAVFGLGLVVGCGGAGYGGMSEVDEAADIAAVEAVTAEEMSSILEGDVAANVALLTDDAVIMPPNSPPAYGVQAAEEFFNDFVGTNEISEAEYVSHDISIHGDVAIDNYVGQLTVAPVGSDEAVTERFKGIHILVRQEDGSWKIAYDIWNSNQPLPEM